MIATVKATMTDARSLDDGAMGEHKTTTSVLGGALVVARLVVRLWAGVLRYVALTTCRAIWRFMADYAIHL